MRIRIRSRIRRNHAHERRVVHGGQVLSAGASAHLGRVAHTAPWAFYGV